MRRLLLAAALILAFALALALACSPDPGRRAVAESAEKPNIVLILTDDQDRATLEHMPNVQRLLADGGTTFENATFSFPLCCPSRASILRGQYPQNHDVLANAAPLGGEGKFRAESLDESTAATWLQAAGYRTGYSGRYLNQYGGTYVPPGWERWFAHASGVEGTRTNENGTLVDHPGVYMDSYYADKAVAFASNSARTGQPFFLHWATLAPHDPYLHEDQYDDDFKDAPLPRPPSFNEADVSDKPAYVRDMPRLTDEQIREFGRAHRDRLRSLQTVDAGVSKLVAALREQGELDETYFFFYSDNGYHLGQRRLYPAGKQTPYLEDSSFPLIVRGPGVPVGATSEKLVLNNDLAPTFAALGGAAIPDFVDGRSIAPLLRGEDPPWRDAALIQALDTSDPRGPAPGYKAVRTEGWKYVEYATGEKELYDLSADPYELQSLHNDPAHTGKMATLKARLEALKGCAGNGCRIAEDGP